MIPLRVPLHHTVHCITSQESNQSKNISIVATKGSRRSLLVTTTTTSIALHISALIFPYPSLSSSSSSSNDQIAKFSELPGSGGVKFLDLRLGSGSTPFDGDQVSIHYYGRLAAKQGWRFDSTYDHKDSTGEPIPFMFVLGSGKVISGIEAAVKSMRVGGIRRVIIPPSQGYQSTTQEPLPPNVWFFLFSPQSMVKMKTSKKRKRGNHNQRKHSSAMLTETWSFYRLMLFPFTQSDKLRIPQNFGMIYGDELCDTATLTVPTGESRMVRLIKEDSTIWFGEGWKEFVEYFNIGYAYFLLFTYEGNSRFRVIICDPTASEVSYPRYSQVENEHHLDKLILEGSCKKGIDCDHNGSNSDGDGDDSLEVLTTPFPEPNHFNVDVIQLDSDDEHDYVSGEKEVKSFEYSKHNHSIQDVPVWLRNCESQMKAATAAGISIPNNPFFVVRVKPYFLDKGQFMPLPNAFVRKHLKYTNVKIARLETCNGRQWKVRYVRTRFRCNLGIGWMFFARQNGLKVGDVCLFELTDAENFVLKVHVAKKSQSRAYKRVS